MPQLLLSGFKVARLPFIGTAVDNFLTATPGLSWIPTGLGYQFYFGGTSLLILVGVAMDTVAQIEAQLVMRNYEGFFGAGSQTSRTQSLTVCHREHREHRESSVFFSVFSVLSVANEF